LSILGLITSLVLTPWLTTAVAAPAAPLVTGGPRARPAAADGDGDGVPDPDDKCPDVPETRNGYEDDDGCPDLAVETPPNDVGRIVDRIAFAYDSADLKPVSFPMLDGIAVVLKLQPQQFPLVALEGHAADNEHRPMALSLARASAIRIALLARGVDAGRLLARASGATAPVCTQHNEGCWRRERTVEFMTLAVPKPAPAAEVERSRDDAPAPAQETAADRAPSPPLARVDFPRGSAVLAPAALADLDLVAGFTKANPVSLEVVGYAESGERRAAALAQARADAVRAYLKACGVLDGHIVTRAELAARATCRPRGASCPPATRSEIRFIEPTATASRNDGGAPPSHH
jgi:outer membrane protein OmpA-like peptidoglycan-associated protein